MSRRHRPGIALICALIFALTCGLVASLLASPARASEPPIAVIGDFGTGSAAAQQVAALVKSRGPRAVVTVGDNAYDTADYGRVVGGPYCRYLASFPPSASCPAEAMGSVNRFFPATGNHDYSDAGIDAYQASFVAARPRTWYAVTLGDVEFLVLDTQLGLDDPAAMAAQRSWLIQRARTSSAGWQVVVMHHPPYSSSSAHGSTTVFQWPFRTWGIDLVLAGHDHSYERLRRWGLTYVVNGAGGADLYPLGPRLLGSVASTDRVHGALFLRTVEGRLQGEFISTDGQLVDRFGIAR